MGTAMWKRLNVLFHRRRSLVHGRWRLKIRDFGDEDAAGDQAADLGEFADGDKVGWLAGRAALLSHAGG